MPAEQKHPSHGGPLAGVRVLELRGIGPVPFAAMLLADLGAEILQLAPPGTPADDGPTGRGRSRITLASSTASMIGFPAARSWFENSTISMPCFVIRPTSVIKPIWL